MTASAKALGTAHDLYALQYNLISFLRNTAPNASEKKEAKKSVRAYKKLLKEIDTDLLGGEDVIISLEELGEECAKVC